MQRTQPASAYPDRVNPVGESAQSAVSWGAVIAGAVIGAAMSAMLMIGGSGLGFMAASPWNNEGASGTTLAVSTIVWMFVTHIIAYGIAGYVTGRLRTKWTNVHNDEIYFRDTAHGFLVWALSVVVGLIILSSTAASIVSGGAKAGATMAGAGAGAVTAIAGQAADSESGGISLDYFTDSLLRPNDPALANRGGDSREEVARILTRSVVDGEMSEQDQSYLVSVVANQAGLSEEEARERLTQVSEQAKQAAADAEQKAREIADAARKAAATFALWAFASLLLGAFVASFSATIGGRARDR